MDEDKIKDFFTMSVKEKCTKMREMFEFGIELHVDLNIDLITAVCDDVERDKSGVSIQDLNDIFKECLGQIWRARPSQDLSGEDLYTKTIKWFLFVSGPSNIAEYTRIITSMPSEISAQATPAEVRPLSKEDLSLFSASAVARPVMDKKTLIDEYYMQGYINERDFRLFKSDPAKINLLLKYAIINFITQHKPRDTVLIPSLFTFPSNPYESLEHSLLAFKILYSDDFIPQDVYARILGSSPIDIRQLNYEIDQGLRRAQSGKNVLVERDSDYPPRQIGINDRSRRKMFDSLRILNTELKEALKTGKHKDIPDPSITKALMDLIQEDLDKNKRRLQLPNHNESNLDVLVIISGHSGVDNSDELVSVPQLESSTIYLANPGIYAYITDIQKMFDDKVRQYVAGGVCIKKTQGEILQDFKEILRGLDTPRKPKGREPPESTFSDKYPSTCLYIYGPGAITPFDSKYYEREWQFYDSEDIEGNPIPQQETGFIIIIIKVKGKHIMVQEPFKQDIATSNFEISKTELLKKIKRQLQVLDEFRTTPWRVSIVDSGCVSWEEGVSVEKKNEMMRSRRAGGTLTSCKKTRKQKQKQKQKRKHVKY